MQRGCTEFAKAYWRNKRDAAKDLEPVGPFSNARGWGCQRRISQLSTSQVGMSCRIGGVRFQGSAERPSSYPNTKEKIIEHVKTAIDDDRITIKEMAPEGSSEATTMTDPFGDSYRVAEKAIRQTWGNDLVVAPIYAAGGSDGKYFMTEDFDAQVLAFRALQLDNMGETKGFHGINERIKVDEHANSIRFYYQLMNNLEDL